jgi:hypothetical protein
MPLEVMHPATELRQINPEIGVGVFATEPIPRGTVTWVRDDLDQVISAERLAAVDPIRFTNVRTWIYRDRTGAYVMCWDLAKHVNHSFSPSTMTTAWELEIAIRDIAPGEEITLDYGTLNDDEPWTPSPEPGATRTVVEPDDLLHHAAEWDAAIAGALPAFDAVEQPLTDLIDPQALKRIRGSIEAGRPLDSIRDCHFGGRGG